MSGKAAAPKAAISASACHFLLPLAKSLSLSRRLSFDRSGRVPLSEPPATCNRERVVPEVVLESSRNGTSPPPATFLDDRSSEQSHAHRSSRIATPPYTYPDKPRRIASHNLDQLSSIVTPSIWMGQADLSKSLSKSSIASTQQINEDCRSFFNQRTRRIKYSQVRHGCSDGGAKRVLEQRSSHGKRNADELMQMSIA
jgi:hypothetical protein